LGKHDKEFLEKVNIVMNNDCVDYMLKEGKYPPIMNFLNTLPNQAGYPVMPKKIREKHLDDQSTN